MTAGDRREAPPPPRRPAIVLASASPRRRELLAALGLPFAVRPVDLDETPRPGEAPRAYVARLAVEKAAAADSHAGELVLAADTVVVLPGEGEDGGPALLGKPADPAEAEAMLARLAGREHVVFTGVALVGGDGAGGGGRRAVAIEESRVRIAPLGPDEIAWYVATGEPLDKAGAYAIQGIGALFVEAVEGNYSNVVGLPLPAVYQLFRELGYDLRSFLAVP
ncbi:MAG TPA: Maf family protein [Thermoanaerobaculia bacterium]